MKHQYIIAAVQTDPLPAACLNCYNILLVPFVTQGIDLICKPCKILVGSALILSDHPQQTLSGSKQTGKYALGTFGSSRYMLDRDTGRLFHPHAGSQIIFCSAERRPGRYTGTPGHLLGKFVTDIV